jgi:hypothetical protein
MAIRSACGCGAVELGAQDYGINTYLSNKPTVVVAVMQRPGSNALDAANKVKAEMDTLSKQFPKLEYSVIYNPTEFISQSIDAVYHTLFEAVILVVIVIWCSCRTGARRSSRSSPSRFADRHGDDAGGRGLFAQFALAVRAGAGDRHRRRRCHRRGRERRAQH